MPTILQNYLLANLRRSLMNPKTLWIDMLYAADNGCSWTSFATPAMELFRRKT